MMGCRVALDQQEYFRPITYCAFGRCLIVRGMITLQRRGPGRAALRALVLNRRGGWMLLNHWAE